MAIEGVADEIATNLEEVAEVTRRIDTRSVGFLFGGLIIGASVGFYFGRRWNREKLRAEAFAESKKELDAIRETYKNRDLARTEKPSVEAIVEERGYSTIERPLKAPVPIFDQDPVKLVEDRVTEHHDVWNYPVELANRSADAPYVIHQDEFNNSELGYSQTTYTYYEVDDVVADTDDTPVPHADIVVGQDNLKWGHGTDDIDVVFVRNDKLELEMEICRVPKSYEEEVLGHSRNETH